MKAARKNGIKKARGRPATGQGAPVVVRMQPALLAMLDDWIGKQKPPYPSRPEAVRQLLQLTLRATVKSIASRTAKKRA